MTGNKIGNLIIVIAFFLCVSIPAYAAETLIFSDTFTDSNGTDLVSHSPDTGTSWQEVIDSVGTHNIQIQSNQARVDATDSSDSIGYVANPASSVADMRVKATMNAIDTSSGDDPFAVFLRYQDTSNFYRCFVTYNTGTDYYVWFSKTVGGTTTDLNGVTDFQAQAGDVLDCSIVGSTYTLKIDDNVVVTGTDSDISAAGKGGMFFGAYALWTDADMNTVWLIDNFEVYEITSDTERRIW